MNMVSSKSGNVNAPAAAATKREIETNPERPRIKPPCLSNLPDCIRQLDHWVYWTYCWVDEHWTKIPYYVVGHYGPSKTPQFERASHADPETWDGFEDVALNVSAREDGGTLGIGFCPYDDDDICFVDLDDCRNRDTGDIADWAMTVVQQLDTYTEISESGTGLKLLLEGKKPGARCRIKTHPGIEIYDRVHFTALTGNRLPGTPADIMPRQAELAALYHGMFPEPETIARPASSVSMPARPADLSDAAIIDRASSAQNSGKFNLLWHGDTSHYSNDASAADQALASLLAFWTRDSSQIVRLMRQSGLRADDRKKWDRKGYLETTVEKALAGSRAFYGDGSFRRGAEWAEEFASVVNLRIEEVPLPARTDSPAKPPSLLASILAVAATYGAPAIPRTDDFATFRVDRGTPGHPDYYQEERDAVEATKRDQYDFDANPCQKTYPLFQTHKYTKRPRLNYIRCRKRHCEGCLKWLNNRELRNARRRFANAVRAGDQLCISTCSAEQLQAVRKKIKRQYANAIAICDNGRLNWTIFSTAKLSGAEPITAAGATESFEIILKEYAGMKRPVRTTRAWSLEKEEAANDHDNHGSIPTSNLYLVDEAAEMAGATLLTKMPRNPEQSSVQRTIYFDRSDGWHDPGLVEHLYSCLLQGEVVPQWMTIKEEDVAPRTIKQDLELSTE